MQHMPNNKQFPGDESFTISKLGKNEIDDSRHKSH